MGGYRLSRLGRAGCDSDRCLTAFGDTLRNSPVRDCTSGSAEDLKQLSIANFHSIVSCCSVLHGNKQYPSLLLCGFKADIQVSKLSIPVTGQIFYG